MKRVGYWHRITDEAAKDARGHLLPEAERVVCFTRGRTLEEAVTNAAADLGRDPSELWGSRACVVRRVAGRFAKSRKELAS